MQAGLRGNEREERMSDATDRAEMERRLIEKSLQDDAFRQRLLEDPRAAVEAGARNAASRRCAGSSRRGDGRHYLPCAALPLYGCPGGQRAPRPGTRNGGWWRSRRYLEWRHLQHRRMLGFHLPRPFRVRVARGVTPARSTRLRRLGKGAVEGI